MSDIEQLERETLAGVAAAETIAALEEVRVGALGKKGVISERMKTLGKMSPEERKTAGAALNVLKGFFVSAPIENLKEMVRFKYRMDCNSFVAAFLYRMLPTTWFNAAGTVA